MPEHAARITGRTAAERAGDLQDLGTCTICGGVLDHTPRLGDWIAHGRCMDAVLERTQEAGRRATRTERARIGLKLAYEADGLYSRGDRIGGEALQQFGVKLWKEATGRVDVG